MKNLSYVEERSKILLPENTGERVYMLEFYKKNGLPAHLSRWQKTVDQLLDGIDTDGPIYLMIDQGFVKAGSIQRRGGVHIDGYWQPALSAHRSEPEPSYDTHNHRPVYDRHNHVPSTHNHKPFDYEIPSSPRHNHTPSTHNHKPFENERIVVPVYDRHSHRPVYDRHNHVPSPYDRPSPIVPVYDNHNHRPVHDRHNHDSLPSTTRKKLKFGEVDLVDWPTEAIILASDIQACRGWNGLYDHTDMPNGDCSHVNVQELQEMMFRKNTVYVGNVTMLHESLPVEFDTLRTVIRLNVPGYNPPSLH